MKRFLINFAVLIIPLIVISSFIEYQNRTNNTFYAKKKHIETIRDSVEIMLLGSSQTWRAINPEFLSFSSAPLAHGGTAFNIDYLLFKKFVHKFQNLKAVIVETSNHTLEEYCDQNWVKNHLFHIYYGINNYENFVPLSDYFLVTANPQEYVKKFWTSYKQSGINNFNKFGFITSANKSIKQRGGYSDLFLKMRFQKENIGHYEKNLKLLTEIIEYCNENSIELILFSPPKYHTYNNLANQNKLKRRNDVLNSNQNKKGIHIWNFERKFEFRDDIFFNEDHLNYTGATIVTREIDDLLNQLLNDYWSQLKEKTELNKDEIESLREISIEYEAYRTKQQKQLSRKFNSEELDNWRTKKLLTIEKKLGKKVKDRILKFNRSEFKVKN